MRAMFPPKIWLVCVCDVQHAAFWITSTRVPGVRSGSDGGEQKRDSRLRTSENAIHLKKKKANASYKCWANFEFELFYLHRCLHCCCPRAVVTMAWRHWQRQLDLCQFVEGRRR